MRRRKFLALTLAGGAAGLVVVLVHPSRRKQSVVLELGELLEDERAAATIGKAYLARAPMENDVQVLGDRLFEDIRWEVLLRSDLRSVLAEQGRHDFRDGRVVRLRGWSLSLTEARLCALTALSLRSAS